MGDEHDVTVAVLSDIQYATDRDDVYIEEFGHMRSYRAALGKAQVAVDHSIARGVKCVVHLGDIIDGRPTDVDRDSALPSVMSELNDVLEVFSRLDASVPVYHTIGNHCLYVGRDRLLECLALTESPYYSSRLSLAWTLIVLDTMDVSLCHGSNPAKRELAVEHLRECAGEANARSWNGGPSPEQISWLENELALARKEARSAVVCGHHPLCAEAAGEQHVAWFANDVLDVFRRYADVVRAYFAGHYHSGGYFKRDGVHHITFSALLDSDDSNSYAFVSLRRNRIEVEGVGNRGPHSRTLQF